MHIFNVPKVTGPLPEGLVTVWRFSAHVRPLSGMCILVLNLINFERETLATMNTGKWFFLQVKRVLMSLPSMGVSELF